MNTRTTIVSTALAAAAIVGAANADIRTFNGSGGTVTDNNATGNRFTINVTESLIMSGVSVTLTNFRHDNMGDLVATLYHTPSGRSVTLFDRIGRTSTSSNGENSDFNGNYTFADGGSNLWAAASTAGSNTDIASGTYAATGSGIGSVAASGPAAQTMNTTFNGLDMQGEWALELKDLRSGTSVSSGWSWSMAATVPAPGAIALLSAAGLIGFGRRRSNKR
jgi:subtilisin-like proprotein convertase family protein